VGGIPGSIGARTPIRRLPGKGAAPGSGLRVSRVQRTTQHSAKGTLHAIRAVKARVPLIDSPTVNPTGRLPEETPP